MDKLSLQSASNYKYLLLALVGSMLFFNTLYYDFVWDDQIVITQNPTTTQGVKGIWEIWTSPNYIEQRSIYRPIPQTIHALLWELSPGKSLINHILNISLFVFTSLVFLNFLKTYFPEVNDWLLFFICLLFVAHPAHSEVVANIKSLDEILSLLFAFLALILIRGFKIRSIILASTLFLAALLCKISAIGTLPLFLIPIIDQYPGKIDTIAKKVKSKGRFPLFLFGFLIFIYALLAYQQKGEWLQLFTLLLAALVALISPNKPLKPFILVLLTILITIEGYWEFSFLFYLIYFSTKDLGGKGAFIYTAIELVIILSVTFIWGQNTLFFSSVVILGLLAIFQYERSPKKLKKIIWLALGFVFLVSFLVGFAETSHNFLLLFAVFAVGFSLLFRNKGIKYLLILMLLVVPSILVDLSAPQTEIPIESLVQVDNESELISNKTPLKPYHNILILEKDFEQKLATICRIQLVYLQKLIFPTALVHQYGSWQIKIASWKDWDVYLSILIHVLLLWLASYFFKKKHYITMWGIIWYFFTISIYTNIFRLMPDTLAERFLFSPSVGFSIALVSGLFFIIQRWQNNERKALITLALFLLPLLSYYSYKTIDRNKDWKTNYTLAANTLPHAQNNAAINAQFALELNNLVKNGQVQNVDSAQALVVKHYKKAIEIFPDFYGPNAYLAAYYILEAQPDSAFPFC